MRLFEGYEAEGRYRGIRTLFVAGDVPWNIIQGVLDTPDKYAQVYFGADGCTYINWETVKFCCASGLVKIISAEVNKDGVPHWVLTSLDNEINFIVKINGMKEEDLDLLIHSIREEWCFNTIQIKFDTDTESYLAPIEAFIQNDRDEIKDDVELWRQE